ncbi:MAG: mechanosensitive ion channel protein [Rheinheimera sp.]|uniref:mechanosensitive ion channel family protein n=1 Tax=Arsukibacterium sp. UBA3155 TaxID=1946058 RepID=UPI000C916345|nr:mechanosensitive ion channel domain-containing protein [Arsukibacterium sp. UBA3155]MAD74035.1 mechanosensitive ion channel protein [Rheinheimera sp.]|tara:strand:- start:98178 stop:99512 length:1335 start_codon:yes stop_codon:yes gene_type:complete
MLAGNLKQLASQLFEQASSTISQTDTYVQLAMIIAIYAFAFGLASVVRKLSPWDAGGASGESSKPIALKRMAARLTELAFPVFAIIMLRFVLEVSEGVLKQAWLLHTALIIAILLLCHSLIRNFIANEVTARLFRWVGLPLLFLHLMGLLSGLTAILQSISLNLGLFEVSLYAVIRVVFLGSFLFWLGRVSSRTGREYITHQENLDVRTREVVAKLFEIAVFFVIALLLLQIMGVNLTALAVFGGALGVGIGLGLQAIASNFISGIIILLDRSVSIGDYVELEDGRTGVVRELNMRSTTLETFNGTDIVVPNEKFIAETFTNWTHKDKRQRYRVDFSVAYHSDVRQLVEIIKKVVASHPQVFSGDDIPREERPDCEIDSFGDSGINMFVEFWMEGIDDGKNRVGGDLLLMILEALQEHGFEIPFPQREVRILDGSTLRSNNLKK